MLAATSTDNKINFVQVPRPAATENTIVVKNKVLGVNYVDSLQARGIFPMPASGTFGTEGAGVVVEVGKGVTDYKVGDRIISFENGSYAEYSIYHEFDLKAHKIPDNVSFETIATIATQGLTAITLVESAYNVKKGDYVLIHAAAGGVGSILVQLVHQKGGIAIGITSSDEKAAFVKELGADHVINYKSENILQRVLEITKGEGVHLSLDSVGGASFEESSIQTLRYNGLVVSYGFAAGRPPPIEISKLFPRNSSIQGSSVYHYMTNKEDADKWWNRLFQLIDQGALKTFVYKTYPFDRLGEALDAIHGGQTRGKLLVELCDSS
ncbi:uncharacterized protein EV154DRAFT_450846 [Mucor mucedo]|uniref:uncharacterized protein n=1 Tax=Mucor mucedo TaxID=29922 RepID=UPI00221EE816|nr:uncharacterized protein EV154DRAFT_450846 [Mucor mucedo]KAI7879839.1 hypothetical protein EV154DRAFT_450846 [Mucor mucedo]